MSLKESGFWAKFTRRGTLSQFFFTLFVLSVLFFALPRCLPCFPLHSQLNSIRFGSIPFFFLFPFRDPTRKRGENWSWSWSVEIESVCVKLHLQYAHAHAHRSSNQRGKVHRTYHVPRCHVFDHLVLQAHLLSLRCFFLFFLPIVTQYGVEWLIHHTVEVDKRSPQ